MSRQTAQPDAGTDFTTANTCNVSRCTSEAAQNEWTGNTRHGLSRGLVANKKRRNAMKTLKKLLTAVIMITALGFGTTREACAVNPDSLTLTVTIGNTLSVRIKDAGGNDLNTYDFGSMLLGNASVNTNPINIDNDSGGLTETYQLSIGDNAGNSLVLRTDTAVLGAGEYRLSALFQDLAPSVAAFGNEDIITGSPKTAQDSAGGQFATGTTGPAEDGYLVADGGVSARLGYPVPNAEVRLWLKLELAASSPVTGLQTAFATVYVNAI
jgi:hypothetical protein